ncbi:MAG: GTPase [Candidatus Helarchaeota archaeon]
MLNSILVMLKTNPSDHINYKIKIHELKEIAKACDYNIILEIIQTRLKPTSNYYIGKGKVEELKELINDLDIKKVIFYNILTSKQKYNLSSTLKSGEIIDRYDLILEIFDKMASDNLSKLQIEKARLLKNMPLIKLQASKKLKAEHPGAMGRGEYAYKSKIRAVQSRISKINNEIEKLKQVKMSWMKKREKLHMPIICLTGNYNSGKTTLFNALTSSDKPVSNTPFTTLSSKYKKLAKVKMVFVDTIGFAIDIDPKIIKSFELTLFDIVNADIILYLVDISDDLELLKVKFLNGLNLLLDLKVDHKKIIILFNKIDMISKSVLKTKLDLILQFFPYPFPYLSISCINQRNFNYLFEKINELIKLNQKQF